MTRLKKYQPRVNEMRMNNEGETIHWSKWDEPHTVAPSADAKPIEEVTGSDAARNEDFQEPAFMKKHNTRPRGEEQRRRDEAHISGDELEDGGQSLITGFQPRINTNLRLDREEG